MSCEQIHQALQAAPLTHFFEAAACLALIPVGGVGYAAILWRLWKLTERIPPTYRAELGYHDQTVSLPRGPRPTITPRCRRARPFLASEKPLL